MIPCISLNALEKVNEFYTYRVTSKVDRLLLFIMVGLRSTHNFLDSRAATRLQCELSTIKPIIVETTNRGTMLCVSVYINFNQKMQGVCFNTNVFIMELKNYDMILDIQWLETLGNIVSNYKDLWMPFSWQSKEVTIKR